MTTQHHDGYLAWNGKHFSSHFIAYSAFSLFSLKNLRLTAYSLENVHRPVSTHNYSRSVSAVQNQWKNEKKSERKKNSKSRMTQNMNGRAKEGKKRKIKSSERRGKHRNNFKGGH